MFLVHGINLMVKFMKIVCQMVCEKWIHDLCSFWEASFFISLFSPSHLTLSHQCEDVKLTDTLPAFGISLDLSEKQENVRIYLFFKQILHSRHCARCFTSFKKNLFNNSVKPLVIFLIYVWESWASEKLNNLAEVTHNSYLQCITLPLRNIAHLHLWACMFERDMVSF